MFAAERREYIPPEYQVLTVVPSAKTPLPSESRSSSWLVRGDDRLLLRSRDWEKSRLAVCSS